MTKMDHIKAILDLYKLILNAMVAATFLLLIYQIQNPEKTTFLIRLGYAVFLIMFCLISIMYIHDAKKLKYDKYEETEKEPQNMNPWWQFWK